MAEDKEKNLPWYEKAAGQGGAGAQFRCGWMYYHGEGAAEDRARGKMWLQKAAEQSEDKYSQKEAEELLREYF